jgi:hypothetical protein
MSKFNSVIRYLMRSDIRTEHLLRRSVLGIAGCLWCWSATAQYVAMSMESQEKDHTHYFGTAKDDKGTLLSDVTFLLESERASFVFVTESDGRFRGALPNEIPTATVAPKCSKAGFEVVRVAKRASPKSAASPSVQVDCVLRRAVAS